MWFPVVLDGKESVCNAGDLGLIPGSGRSPGDRNGPTPGLLPGEVHGQRRLASYSTWGHKESDITAWLTLSVHFPKCGNTHKLVDSRNSAKPQHNEIEVNQAQTHLNQTPGNKKIYIKGKRLKADKDTTLHIEESCSSGSRFLMKISGGNRGAWQATVHGVARVRHDLVTKPPPKREWNSIY